VVCGGSGSPIHVVFVKLKDSLEQLADVLIHRECIPPNNTSFTFTIWHLEFRVFCEGLHSQFGILNLECFAKELSLFSYAYMSNLHLPVFMTTRRRVCLVNLIDSSTLCSAWRCS